MQTAQSSHSKFQDTQVNIGVGEDVIIKDEFDFKPTIHLEKSLKFLQRLSIIAIFLSISQIVYGGFCLYYFPSRFSSLTTFTGILSLLLSISGTIWSTKALKAERDGNASHHNVIDGGWERMNSALFLASMLRCASSFVLIPNMLMQADSVSQHARAYGSTFNDSDSTMFSSILNTMALVLPFVELLLSIISAQAAKTCFNYIKDPARTASRLVYLSSIILLGSSLGLIFSVLRAQGFSSYNDLQPETPRWCLKGLFALGVALVMTSFLIWLVNYKRWRVPSLLVWAMMIGIGITLAGFTFSSYSHRQSVYSFYKDTSDLTSWSYHMANVHKDDIEAFGCPLKYLPSESCERPTLVNVWEAGTSDSNPKCLNVACSGLLGGYYSEPFLEITNFGLSSIVSAILILLGGLYFWRSDWRTVGHRNKKELGWLAPMGAIVILFFIALISVKSPLVGPIDKKIIINDLMAPYHDQWFGGSGITMDAKLAQKLTDLILLKKSRYVIMKLNPELDRISLAGEGDYSKTYKDFVEALDPQNAEVALLRFPQGKSKDSLIGIVWLPSSTPEETRKAYMKHYVVEQTDPRFEKLGFPIQTASSKQRLEDSLTAEQAIFQQELLFGESTLSADPANALTVLAANVRLNAQLPPGEAMEVFQMVMFQKYKFLTFNLNLNQSKVSIDSRGNWNQTYDGFVKHFSNGQPKAGLIYLEVEGRNQLVVVVLEDDTLAKKHNEVIAANGIPDFQLLKDFGILPYFARDTKDLKLQKVLAGISSEGLARQQTAQAISKPAIMSLYSLNPFTDGTPNTGKNRYETFPTPFSSGSPTIAGFSTVPNSVEGIRNRIRSVLVGEVGFSLGGEIFKMVTMNKYKYIISRYNTSVQKPEIASEGSRDASYDNFVQNINPNQAQVSLIYLDLEGSDRLVMIIYAPEGSYNDPTTVYQLFGLPTDPYKLELLGLKVFVARKMSDLKLDNVMKNLYGDQAQIMNLLGHSQDSAVEIVYQSPGRMLLGASEAAELLKTVVAQKNKYVVLKWNPVADKVVLTKTGDWNASFESFVNAFDEREEQVGLVYLELENLNKSVLVTYAPKNLNKNSSQILRDFNLPSKLDSLGVNVYGANSKSDLTVKNILRSVYTNVTEVHNLIEDYQLMNLLSGNEVAVCKSCHNHHNSTHFTSDDYSDYNDYILSDDSESDVDVFRVGAHIHLFGKMGLRLKRDIVKPLKSKQLKYIILKHDVSKNKVYIANSGNWFATFDQFAREFEPGVPQVGFIYLEVEGLDQLVMTVYAPSSLNTTYTKVLREFDVTKNPAKLRKKGIETFVVTDLDLMTLDNIMGAAFGVGTNAKLILTEMMEEYAAGDLENSMMFALSTEQMLEINARSQITVLASLGLKVKRNLRKLITSHKNKYVILRKNPDQKGQLEVKSIGSWHATYDQFAREFDSTDDQVGFIYLELDGKEKLLTVLYAPRSYNQSFSDIFKGFGIARNVKKLEKKGISVYVARNDVDLQFENVINNIFNDNDKSHGVHDLMLLFSSDATKINLPVDIADAINNKKYKYVVLQRNNKKNLTEITSTGDWGNSYEDAVKQVKRRKDQLIFVNLNLESKSKLVLIVFAHKTATAEVLRSFGLPQDIADIESAGISVYPARHKSDLDIFKVLSGIYTRDAKPSLFIEDQAIASNHIDWLANDDPGKFFSDDEGMLSLWEEEDARSMFLFAQHSPYTESFKALNHKTRRFAILKRDAAHKNESYILEAPWNFNFNDFVSNFDGKTPQVGFFKDEQNDKVYVVVFAPGSTDPKQVLTDYQLPTDISALSKAGLKKAQSFLAREKEDITLENLRAGTEVKALTLLYTEQELPVGKDVLDAINNKKFKYIILKHDPETDKTYVAKFGKWDTTYDDFRKDFSRKDAQLGIIHLTVESRDLQALVIYSPKLPGTEVVRQFGLPSDLSSLRQLGFRPYIARKKKELNLLNVLQGLYNTDLYVQNPSLFVGETGLSLSAEVFKDLAIKNHKYMVLRRDANGKIHVANQGDWQASIDQFANSFSSNEDQVGFIHLPIEDKTKLVFVVFTPKQTNKDISDILSSFNLPKNPGTLEKLGASVYIAHKKSDINVNDMLNTAYTPGDLGKVDVNSENWNPSNSSAETGTGLWLEAIKTMAAKKNRYLVVTRDLGNNKLSITAKGDWNDSYDNFVKNFDANRDQVGLVYIGPTGNEKLVVVVFASEKSGNRLEDVAKNFNLPRNPSKLQKMGFTPYIAHTKDDLQYNKVLESVFTQVSMFAADDQVDLLDSNMALWENRDGFSAPDNIGFDYWIRLFDLQGELKRKIADITVDDNVIDTWNDFVVNQENGYALISTGKGSLRLSTQKVRKGLDVTYNDFLHELADEPLFALVFTQDLIRQTNIRVPVLIEWNPKEVGLVKANLSRDRLKPLAVKLNNPKYVYIADNTNGASFDRVVEALNNGTATATAVKY